MNDLLHRSAKLLKKKAPTILTFLGAAGVVTTTITAVKATPKAMELLKQAENEKGEGLTRIEKIQVAGPTYIPSILLGVSTITCIFGANTLNKQQQAAITSAYAFLSESHQKYRNAAKSVYGEDADAKIHAEMAKDVYVSADGYYVYDLDSDKKSEEALFFDSYSHRYFTSTMPAVINAQYHVNRNFALRGGVAVNEFYEFLGIDGIDGGEDIGWGYKLREDGFDWIDFENRYTEMEDGMECYIISTMFDPSLPSDDDWY